MFSSQADCIHLLLITCSLFILLCLSCPFPDCSLWSRFVTALSASLVFYDHVFSNFSFSEFFAFWTYLFLGFSVDFVSGTFLQIPSFNSPAQVISNTCFSSAAYHVDLIISVEQICLYGHFIIRFTLHLSPFFLQLCDKMLHCDSHIGLHVHYMYSEQNIHAYTVSSHCVQNWIKPPRKMSLKQL